MTSRSSPPLPRSTATAMTSAPMASAIQPMATEVSRPPEYARTTRSVIGTPCWFHRLYDDLLGLRDDSSCRPPGRPRGRPADSSGDSSGGGSAQLAHDRPEPAGGSPTLGSAVLHR